MESNVATECADSSTSKEEIRKFNLFFNLLFNLQERHPAD